MWVASLDNHSTVELSSATDQVVNPNLTNEKIFSVELGYGYRSSNLKANVNLFRTFGKIDFKEELCPTVTDINNVQYTNAYAEGIWIEQVHLRSRI